MSPHAESSLKNMMQPAYNSAHNRKDKTSVRMIRSTRRSLSRHSGMSVSSKAAHTRLPCNNSGPVPRRLLVGCPTRARFGKLSAQKLGCRAARRFMGTLLSDR